MKHICVIMLLWLLSFSSSLLALDHEVLIALDLATVPDLNAFEALKLPVYHQQDNTLILGVQTNRLPEIQNLHYSMLDNDAWHTHYYLLTTKSGRKNPVSCSQGTILWHNDTQALIASTMPSDLFIGDGHYAGTELRRIPSFFSNSRNLFQPYDNPERTTIQQLVDGVNADSLEYFVQQLQNFGTRFWLADTKEAIAHWIYSQFRRMGYTDVRIDSFQIQNSMQKNVIATLPGNQMPELNIVIGGHSDTNVSFQTNNPNMPNPGADDNGSGVAAVLEIARVMKTLQYQPKCTLRFATFAVEEIGLVGGYLYNTVADIHNEQIKLMINHDMIGSESDYPNYHYVVLNYYTGYEGYSQMAANAVTQYTDCLGILGMANSAGSDSYTFWHSNRPATYFEEFHFSSVYHSIHDSLRYMNMDYMTQSVKGSMATTAIADGMPSPIPSVTIRDTGTGSSLLISWNPPPEANIDHYLIQWGTESGTYSGEFTTSSTSCTVADLETGTEYFVGVAAVNTDGLQGLITERSCIPNDLPATPSSFIDQPQMHAIQLNWGANGEMDLTSYVLYRSETTGVLGTQLAEIPAAFHTYTDTNVTDGIYYYYALKAKDAEGNESPNTEQIYSRAISLNQGILIVDATSNGSGTSISQPSDQQVDDFYNTLLAHFQHTQYDISSTHLPRLADFGAYSTILWHCNTTVGSDQFNAILPVIQSYLQFGGNLLMSTYQPGLAIELNGSYPQTFATDSSIYSLFGIAGVNGSTSTRFKTAVSNVSELEDIVVNPDLSLAGLNHHLVKIEGMTPAPGATVLYTFGSEYANDTPQGLLNGSAVGIAHFGNDYNTVALSFPLYNMNPEESEAMVHYLFTVKFGEQVGTSDPVIVPCSTVQLLQNHPNPFNPQTIIQFNLPLQQHATIAVFNMKGQLVRTLLDATMTQGNHQVTWNGMDDQGHEVGSGVYFYRLTTPGAKLTRRMIMIK